MLFKDRIYLEVNSMDELTPKVLLRVTQAFNMNVAPKLKKMLHYYRAENEAIINKPKVSGKPDSRVINAFGRTIVEQTTNIFMSEGIKYTSDNAQALLELEVVNAMNDEPYHTFNLAKDASIYGVAYELLYMDANSEIRFARLNPEQTIPVFSTGITMEQIGAIRFYTVESLDDELEDKHYIEVYTDESIFYYENVGGALRLNEEIPHYFGQCPVTVYSANEQDISDIAPVITLIDSYDELMSSVDNMYRYFDDCYLMFTGIDEISPDDVSSMKNNRIILLPEGGNAQFLAKTTDSASLNSQFDRIKDNIYKFSYCIPIEDTQFGNDVSGIALRYRMMMLEGVCSARERLFRQAIGKRIEMIFAILAVKGKHYNADEIDMVFTMNIPANETEIINQVTALTGIISKETALDLLPMVDAKEELSRLEEEQEGLNEAMNPYAGVEFTSVDDDEIPAME